MQACVHPVLLETATVGADEYLVGYVRLVLSGVQQADAPRIERFEHAVPGEPVPEPPVIAALRYVPVFDPERVCEFVTC